MNKAEISRAEWLANLARAATPDIEECISMLGEPLDWLHRLKETEQDSVWHAEGNVHIHTGMVLDEVYKLLSNEADHIRGSERQILILAALLHDIAKPVRTRHFEMDGEQRIGSPQHAYYGSSYLAFKLPNLELEFEVIWSILCVVAEHHTPRLLVTKNLTKSDYFKHARQANTELVYWLEVADIRGRLCPDPELQIQQLDEYRMFSEEYKVWGKEYDVRTELTPSLKGLPKRAQDYIYGYAIQQLESGKIYSAEEALGTTYQNRDSHSHVVILCGPSGSGKSSFTKINYPGYSVVSLDDLRDQINGDRGSQKNKGQIMQLAKEQLRVQLRKQGDVVWDATNLRKDFRSIVSTLSQDYRALVTLVVFIQPERSIHKNNQQRQHSVASDVLNTQIDRYQMPLLSEAHQVLVIGADGEAVFQSGQYSKR